jgi:hypothetical protein
MSLSGNKPATSGQIGEVQATPTQFTLLGRLKDIWGVLSAIGSDTTPVPVTANLISGNRAFVSLGSPSTGTNNSIGYSDAFAPNGETISCDFAGFSTGKGPGNDAFAWVEQDLSGGTAYKQVAGTRIDFASLPNWAASNKSWAANWNVRGGNCRIGINFGTLTGTTGVYGYNVKLLN